jgi:hypothetical protein
MPASAASPRQTRSKTGSALAATSSSEFDAARPFDLAHPLHGGRRGAGAASDIEHPRDLRRQPVQNLGAGGAVVAVGHGVAERAAFA